MFPHPTVPLKRWINFTLIMNKALRHCKSHDIRIIMGDLKTKVGRNRDGETDGSFDLEQRYD